MNSAKLNKHQIDWFVKNFDSKPKSYILDWLGISERNYDTLVRRLKLDPLASYENRYGDVTRPNDGMGLNVSGWSDHQPVRFRHRNYGKNKKSDK